jgi:protein-arginine kinase activator protein McsA
MDFNNFFSNFNFDDFFNINYSFKEKHDWEELKKQGRVEEYIEEKNGIRTITKIFNNGEKTITYSSSEFIDFYNKKKLDEIEKEIQNCIQLEDYEKAHILKKQKDILLNKPSKNNE